MNEVVFIIEAALCVYVLVYAVLVLMSISSWRSIRQFVADKDYKANTRISVIVPARNEEHTIGDCLRALSNQLYSETLFEIIVVDDHSEDNTAKIIREHVAGSTNMRLVSLENFEGKKEAIAKGIESAQGELIVTTDADCIMGQLWLSSIAQYHEMHRPKMIVMPVLYSSQASGFMGMQALEFMSLIGITGAAIGLNKPILCNGANLAYTKQAYRDVHGFDGNEGIASGDDVFLLHKISKADSSAIHYLKSTDVVVSTSPKPSLKAFFRQRLRWASKAPLYKDTTTQAVSFVVFFVNALFLIGLAFSPFHLKMVIAVLLSFSVKCIIDFIFLFLVASTFRSERLLWFFLPVQLFYPIYVVVVAIGSVTIKTTWKGRNIN